MSSELMKKISGQLTDLQGVSLSQLPFGITIELTSMQTSPPGPGGWIGSAPIKATGNYELFTAYDIGLTEYVLYQIYKDEQPVKSGSVLVSNHGAENIPLSQDEYVQLMGPDPDNYVTIKGNVTLGTTKTSASPSLDSSAFPVNITMTAVPNGSRTVTVSANKAKFKDSSAIISTTIDDYGNYCLKIPVNLLNNTVISGSSTACNNWNMSQLFISLNIKATSGPAIEIIERTANIELTEQCNTIDINTEKTNYYTAFYTLLEYLNKVVTKITGYTPAQFYTITVDGENSELNQIIAESGLDATPLSNLIYASIKTQSTTIEIGHTYALTNALGNNTNAWTSLSLDELTALINEHVNKHIIPVAGNIARTYGLLSSMKENIFLGDIDDNGNSIDTVLKSFINDSNAIRTFVKLSNELTSLSPDEFWQRIDIELPLQSKRLQYGLQVMSIAGMQPQTVQYMMDTIGGEYSNPNSPKIFATYGNADWMSLVQAVTRANGKVFVPEYIKATTPNDDASLTTAYAGKLMELTHDLYATAVINDQLTKDQAFFNAFNGNGAVVKSFLQSQPDLDLRFDSAWDAVKIAKPEDVTLRTALLPLQNIMRIATAQPLAVAAMITNGIKSSVDIASMSIADFVTTYDGFFKGQISAAQIYATAQQTALVTAQTQTQYNPQAISLPTQAVQLIDSDTLAKLFSNPPGNSQTPDLQTLFGSMDSCSCSECTSIYSPGAYFTDILNFIQKQLVITGAAKQPYDELLRRRPDLIHIDLTCKNANTALPYVDLVNELLELEILASKGNTVPNSYQTSGKSVELDAYPEHKRKVINALPPYGYTYQDYDYSLVYDSILKDVIYPSNKPLNLAIEESRTYFNHLGFSRFDLMQYYKPSNYASSLTISEYNAAAEWLGLSRFAADIIITPYPSSIQWKFYGYETEQLPPVTGPFWYNDLCYPATTPSIGLRNLLNRANISYTELLQLLITNFLNPAILDLRKFSIKSVVASAPDTCDLSSLKLNYTGTNEAEDKKVFFHRLHHFLRLQRATGWSIYQLDIVLSALSVTDINEISFKQVVRIHQLGTRLNAAPEAICAFWTSLSKVNYINFNADNQDSLPSVYDNIFKNKAIINPPDPSFANPDLLPATYIGHTGTIIGAISITEEELIKLFAFVNAPPASNATHLDLPVLSRVYAFSILAKGLNISIDTLLRICALYQQSGVNSGGIAAQLLLMQNIIDEYQTLSTLAFTLDEVEYLFEQKDKENNFTPTDETISLFYTNVRTELKKQYDAGQNLNDASMINIIVRRFSTTFSIEGELAQYLLESILTIDGAIPLEDTLIDPVFINSNIPLVRPAYNGIFNAYIRAHKIALIVNRLHISTLEFKTVQLPFDVTPPANSIVLFDFPKLANIPVVETSTPAAYFLQFIKLSDWLRNRDRLYLRKEEFATLLTTILAINGNPSSYLDYLTILTNWDNTALEFLVGTASNILATTYSSTNVGDFLKASLLAQMADIMDANARLGLTAQLTYNALLPGMILTDSRPIRQAAKAKHTNDEWLKIAKPLQDVLREKQRKALVAYMVAHPEIGDPTPLPATSSIRWTDENGLFAYYLIDVEMQPCMRTSRIKQGISSLQLFMDRLIMNLENTNGDTTKHLIIRPDKVEQWESWRKWYRIWEANRKIFLYPENWIEPELRDDKTPFFKDLETQLLQDAVTDATAEDAFRTYLEAVDEVSKLEPITAYHQLEKDSKNNITVDIKHVFSRTTREPYRYFYRRLENNTWSPWEKVNADIKSNHVVPLVFNGRLFLFWMTFAKKNKKGDINSLNKALFVNKILSRNIAAYSPMTISVDTNQDDLKFSWDLKLNWSQFKDGKWLASEMVADPVSLFFNKYELTDIEAGSYNIPAGQLTSFFNSISKSGECDLAEFFKARTFISVGPKTPLAVNGFAVNLLLFGGLNENAVSIVSYVFPDANTKPYVERLGDNCAQLLSPIGTRANNMKFEKISRGQYGAINDKLQIEKVATKQDRYFAYFQNWWYTNNGPFLYFPHLTYNTAKVPTPLLDQTGRSFRLTKFGSVDDYNFINIQIALGSLNPGVPVNTNSAISYTGANSVLNDYFFFEDETNTFYVKRIDLLSASVSLVANKKVTLGAVSKIATTGYPLYTTLQVAKPILNNLTIAGGNSITALAITPAAAAFQATTYHFETFYHAQIHDFLNVLDKGGVPALLQLSNQNQNDKIVFGSLGAGTYKPTSWVNTDYPRSNVQFAFTDSYGIYNWEIFFHTPMIIAQRLSDNQQFEDAQKWYHYIFNPLSTTDMNGAPIATKKRFWKFYPFYVEASQTPQTLNELLLAINTGVSSAVQQVKVWEQNPFQPHVIARMRKLAYMKNVLMKYLDNLIAWGDQLFRRDTIESINEASQLYILAANILGNRPVEVPVRVKKNEYTYNELLDPAIGGGLDAFSNAMVNIESFFAPNTGTPTGTSNTGTPIYGKTFYFCLPQNDKLLNYWDTVADRLFKIRNCMNIDGTVRQLPLYEPPIDPALLVRATALGIDIASIVNTYDSATHQLNYRFSYMLQKANEFCGEVRSFGNALLSAIEKKDSESLSLLRSGQEINMLDKMTIIKENQVSEAQAALDNLLLTKENTQLRYEYYSTRPFMNDGEQQQLRSIQTGLSLQAVQSALQTASSSVSLIPQFSMQTPFAVGPTFGGQQVAGALNAISAAMGISVAINNAKGSMAGTKGSYDRRNDDWVFQTDTASKELEQMDQQILSAQIRLNIANRELDNHLLQIENTKEVDDFMRTKFSNVALYNWMITQISSTYFKCYQLAYDLAKTAESCYKYEFPMLAIPNNKFITFGYWDSLRKGLMSGEMLQFDLRKMESSFMDTNKRELELTKNVSLALNDPKALLDLRNKGFCDIYLPEAIYDLDFPGHLNRRIKSVSISIPCIAGPYTTIPATLILKESYIRTLETGNPLLDGQNLALPRVATSTAQNDAGMFELNFRDERYLPFEGRGAISKWQLSLIANQDAAPSPAPPKQVRNFDFDTISDVILHIRYTAMDSASITFKNKRITDINNLLVAPSSSNSAGFPNGLILPRYFSLKHEFSNEWYKGFNSVVDITYSGTTSKIGRPMNINLRRDQFPEYADNRSIITVNVICLITQVAGTIYKLVYNNSTTDLINPLGTQVNGVAIMLLPTDIQKPFNFILYKVVNSQAVKIEESELEDLFFIINYSLSV